MKKRKYKLISTLTGLGMALALNSCARDAMQPRVGDGIADYQSRTLVESCQENKKYRIYVDWFLPDTYYCTTKDGKIVSVWKQ